ncbi:MAG: hypothetical protein N2B03_06020, partial [Boseongicola sp.]
MGEIESTQILSSWQLGTPSQQENGAIVTLKTSTGYRPRIQQKAALGGRHFNLLPRGAYSISLKPAQGV